MADYFIRVFLFALNLEMNIIYCMQSNTIFALQKGRKDWACDGEGNLFRFRANSLIQCSTVCKSNSSCLTFSYNKNYKFCTGCFISYAESLEISLQYEPGSNFYEGTPLSESTTLSSEPMSTTSTTGHRSDVTVTSLTTTREGTTSTTGFVSTSTARLTSTTSVETKTTSSEIQTTLSTTNGRWNNTNLPTHMNTSGKRLLGPMLVVFGDGSFEGSVYYLLDHMNYFEAMDACPKVLDKGHLTYIDNEEENDYLKKLIASYAGDELDMFYIGQSIVNELIVYELQSDQIATFTNEFSGLAALMKNGCIILNASGKWSGVSCKDNYPSICEKDSDGQ